MKDRALLSKSTANIFLEREETRLNNLADAFFAIGNEKMSIELKDSARNIRFCRLSFNFEASN